MSSADTLRAPYATSSAPETYGPIGGSNPSWQTTNFHDRGKSHRPSTVRSELHETGIGSYLAAPEPADPFGRRHYSAGTLRQAVPIAEPAAAQGHHSYYSRRQLNPEDPLAYRRTLKHVPEPVFPEKPQGVRYIPEPHGPPPHINSLRPAPDEVRFRASESAPEPALPRLARLGPSLTCLRETEKEVVFEQTMNRKVRVEQESYRGLGLAGDNTGKLGVPSRPETQDPSLFKTLTDSPTFIRFVSSLPPKPAVSPHERRMQGIQRQRQAELDGDRALVAQLDIPGVDDD